MKQVATPGRRHSGSGQGVLCRGSSIAFHFVRGHAGLSRLTKERETLSHCARDGGK